MNKYIFDLHSHSHYSSDCKSHPKDIIKQAIQQKLSGIAITDHNTTKFHHQNYKDNRLLILTGVEVSTKSGHIIGLGIKEAVKKRLSIEETIEKIIDMNGLPIAPHPFDFTRKGIGKKIYSLEEITVETLNGSSPFDYFNEKAEKWATQNNLPVTGGSDAHRIKDIGMAYTIFENEVNNIDDAIEQIRKRKTTVGGTHLTLGEKFIRAFQIHF
ncbi:MAG: PHP domain-containing protein [Candidatus Heimdallarchaeota archaeon]|nr:PHP domain-containing protein [Candidatus Heimdallarchaeota archaeon]